jgi:hypothetical protein
MHGFGCGSIKKGATSKLKRHHCAFRATEKGQYPAYRNQVANAERGMNLDATHTQHEIILFNENNADPRL